jgi:two-component sensor histidine kinase
MLDLDNRRFVVAGVSDVTARVEAQAAVVQSLREKETMLQEIHHRVKNNLQIISSLLMLQSDQIPSEEVRAPLTDSVHRVRSMALIHHQLYSVESMERVDMGDYARNLSESLRSALMPSARLCVQAEVTEVPLNDAVPLGLILNENELVTNALKYGIPKPGTEEAARVGRAGEGCDVRIELGIEDGVLRLAVLDSGIGLPEAFDPKGLSSLGLHLVSGLTRQLRGEFEYDVDCGSRFVVTYKKSS